MGKKNQPGGRGGRSMAKSDKALNSAKSDRHLMSRKDLARDSVKQQEFINRIRQKSGLPPVKRIRIAVDKTSIEFHEGDRLGVENGDLILAQRLYSRGGDGNLVGNYKSEDECIAAHSRVRRDRAVYRELDGRMVRAGDVIGTRKGKYMKSRKDDKRRAPGVLRSIMVRLMPHEGEIVGEFIEPERLAEAMDKTVLEFSNALGCDVVSAVVHRMNGWDCHIHIQYTMIKPIEETASMLGRRLKPWKEKASVMARAALLAEKIDNPAPRTVGAKINDLVKTGKLESKPVADIEYRKFVGERSLLDSAISGYSFRHKLNLVRVAEEAGDSDLAERVTQMRDGPGKFRTFAKRGDAELEDQYLDLWLERVWRKSVREQLPEVALEKLLPAGVESATDYATYGTVLVEETHIDRRKKELNEQQSKMDSTAAAVRLEADKAVKEAERAKRKALKDKEAAEGKLQKKDSDWETARESANKKITEKNSELATLQLHNKHLGDLVAKFIQAFLMILDLPGFQTLLETVPEKVRKAVDSLRVDIEREMAGVDIKAPKPKAEIAPKEPPNPLSGLDENNS